MFVGSNIWERGVCRKEKKRKGPEGKHYFTGYLGREKGMNGGTFLSPDRLLCLASLDISRVRRAPLLVETEK